MNYTLIITCSSHSDNAENALRFAQALLAKGHQLTRIFFYGDGVHLTSSHAVAPQGEQNLPSEWQRLIEHHAIDSVVCVAAGLKRGLLNETEAERHGKSGASLLPSHELSGLGQLIDATQSSDRVMTFN